MNKLCDTQRELALQLATHMVKSVKEFCFMKNISEAEISDIVYQDAFNQLAEELGLNVKMVEEPTEEPIINSKESKETPLEIINRTVTKVENKKVANSLSSSIEVALIGDTIMVL